MSEYSFANTPRISGKPFKRRIGNNLLERDRQGHVSLAFGYYTPQQELARKLWAKKVMEAINLIINKPG